MIFAQLTIAFLACLPFTDHSDSLPRHTAASDTLTANAPGGRDARHNTGSAVPPLPPLALADATAPRSKTDCHWVCPPACAKECATDGNCDCQGCGAKVTSWTTTDRNGHAWTHPDKEFLIHWVTRRNRELKAQAFYAQQSTCPNGRCNRR